MDMRRACLLAAMGLIVTTGVGCGGKPEPAATSVSTAAFQGQFRGGSGMVFVFTEDGRFGVQGNPATGSFRLDGDVLTLTPPQGPTGQTVSGKRLGPDEIVLAYPTGVSEHLFRVDSALAQSTRANPPPRSGPPALAQPTHLVSAADREAEPDRSVPLEGYVPLTDPNEINLIAAAVSKPAWTDEQKLLLSPNVALTGDAFKRREIMEKEIPGINAAIAAHEKQRYVRVELVTVPLNRFNRTGWKTIPLFGWFNSAFEGNQGNTYLLPYDFDKKGFALPGTLSGLVSCNRCDHGASFQLSPEPANSLNFLPVKDEAMARRIEELRSSNHRFAMSGTLYLFVLSAPPPSGRVIPEIHARLMHADLTLIDDTNNRYNIKGLEDMPKLGAVSLDFRG